MRPELILLDKAKKAEVARCFPDDEGPLEPPAEPLRLLAEAHLEACRSNGYAWTREVAQAFEFLCAYMAEWEDGRSTGFRDSGLEGQLRFVMCSLLAKNEDDEITHGELRALLNVVLALLDTVPSSHD